MIRYFLALSMFFNLLLIGLLSLEFSQTIRHVDQADPVLTVTRRGDQHPELQDVSLPPPQLYLQWPLAAALCAGPQSAGQPVFLDLLSPTVPGPGPVYEQEWLYSSLFPLGFTI